MKYYYIVHIAFDRRDKGGGFDRRIKDTKI